MEQVDKLEFRTYFLKAFVKAVVMNVEIAKQENENIILEIKEAPKIENKVEGVIPFVQQVKMPPIPLPPTSQQNQPTRPIFKQPSNFSIQKRNLFPNLLRRMPNARPLDRPSSRLIEVNPKLQTMALPPPPPPSSEGNKKDSSSGGKDKIDMGRIAQILRDPAVLSVECPGPGKNVLVNKAGLIQATAIKFTKEEINEILNEFAEQTRIPLVQGMFKAAFKDILITAVVSDFVGTRFVIQKRAPYQLY